jgi:hypothetical protein
MTPQRRGAVQEGDVAEPVLADRGRALGQGADECAECDGLRIAIR